MSSAHSEALLESWNSRLKRQRRKTQKVLSTSCFSVSKALIKALKELPQRKKHVHDHCGAY